MHGTIGPIARTSDGAGPDVLDGFERMQCGGILLDEHGRVLHLNARAYRYLEDGLNLADQHITAQCDSANRALQGLITTALQPQNKRAKRAGQVLSLPRSGARPLMVRVLRAAENGHSALESARVVLLILDPDERPRLAEGMLQAVFCLTSTEARVAIGVMCGDTLEEIAQAHQTSFNTVRRQIQAVFAKTQTCRQAELVTLLTRMAPVAA